MGSVSKLFGQLAARSLESESSNILRTASANKTGLSRALDATLRANHNMRIFGLGTAASLASRERYGRFSASMHAVYATMERSLDASTSPPVKSLWGQHGDALRRANALKADLDEVGVFPHVSGCGHMDDGLYFDSFSECPSEATATYLEAIHAAAEDDDATGGGRLLGHVYCRYFADLFGGQALALPTRWALSLSDCSPRHYDFGEFGHSRRDSIQAVYVALNEAGEMMDELQRSACVAEAATAFARNVDVYAEEAPLALAAAHGIVNVATGFVRTRARAFGITS